MPSITLLVEETFDLAARAGLLVSGRLLEGSISVGATLVDAETGRPVRVLGVEFLTPTQIGTDRITLLVEREGMAALRPGARVLLGH